MPNHIDNDKALYSISDDELKRLTIWLKGGNIIALPTETVYGLGVDATNLQAVKSLYDLKLRSADKPLSLMVANPYQARGYTAYWPDAADKLAEAFWPGPLTMVFRKSHLVPENINTIGDTVGLRCPAHSITLQLLDFIDFPLATTSANYSGRKALVSADQVKTELGDHREIQIIDGGKCRESIESTVIDLTHCWMSPDKKAISKVVILRSGAVTREQICDILSNSGVIIVDK